MGKFTNSTYTGTIKNLVTATNEKINNPYYKFTDKKPTTVTYYKQNREQTTLDPDTGTNYQHVGNHSPIKFNKINNFVLYGMGRIELSYEVGDFGLESNQISGEAIILPKTIVPTQGDFFSVPYIKEDLLFKVNSVTTDTLDNGSNFYKIEYAVELVDQTEQIEKQVVKVYNFITENVGTDFNAFLSEDTYDLISELERLLEYMWDVYQLFFDNSVQTFVFKENGEYFYDPYLIEFIIRTKLMTYAKEYFHVCHATYVDNLFDYRYSKSFFNMIEHPETFNRDNAKNIAYATKIEDVNSLFVTRLESYYRIDYFDKYKYITRFLTFSDELLNRIASNEYYNEDDENYVDNLWIGYFNNNLSFVNTDIGKIIRSIDFENNKKFYYFIPIVMYIIVKSVEGLMKSE